MKRLNLIVGAYVLIGVLLFGVTDVWSKPVEKTAIQKVSEKIEKSEGAEKEPEPEIDCALTFWEEKRCPKEACALGCYGGENVANCPLVCNPRPCFQIEAKYCPLSRCEILKGCSGKDVCYDVLDDGFQECGDLAYSGQGLDCCEGFVKRCGVEFFDGSCDMKAKFSAESVPMCIPCGNGICNQFENRCNCPEDCL